MGIVGGGGCAEYVAVHERTAARVPGGLSLVDAGAVPEVFMTAFDALFLQEGLESGETVLVHAVGSATPPSLCSYSRAFVKSVSTPS